MLARTHACLFQQPHWIRTAESTETHFSINNLRTNKHTPSRPHTHSGEHFHSLFVFAFVLVLTATITHSAPSVETHSPPIANTFRQAAASKNSSCILSSHHPRTHPPPTCFCPNIRPTATHIASVKMAFCPDNVQHVASGLVSGQKEESGHFNCTLSSMHTA